MEGHDAPALNIQLRNCAQPAASSSAGCRWPLPARMQRAMPVNQLATYLESSWSAFSYDGAAQRGSPLKHCGARDTRTAAAGSNLPHLRGE